MTRLTGDVMAAHISGSPNGGHAVRRAVLRVLLVTALAVAGLLIFGLLPGGRDAPMAVPLQYPLPSVTVACDLHPHGPNRPPDGRHTAQSSANPHVAIASEPVHPAPLRRH